MKKYLLYSLFSLSCFLIFTSGVEDNNGKAGRTGSPSEQTCVNGCHSSYALNSGPGSVVLTSNIPVGGYTPGQSYAMHLTVTHAGVSLFGLGLEALTSTNANGGTLTAGAGNQIKSTTIGGVSRKNITHTLGGGSGTSGSHNFPFTWVAPAVGTGNVTFYFSGVAANGANGNQLDYVYNSSQIIPEYVAPSALVETNTTISSLQIFSNPVSGNLSFGYSLDKNESVFCILYSLNGAIAKQIFTEQQTEGIHTSSTDISDLSKGIYLLELKTAQQTNTRKIVVQ